MTEQLNSTSENNTMSSNTDKVSDKSKDFVSRDDMNALLDKVRKQEADKVRKDREETERQNAELKAELELIKQNLARKVDLPKPEPPADPTVKELLAQIEELKVAVTGNVPKQVDETALLQKATDLARKEAEKLHFENMRASLIASSGLPDYMLPLINGADLDSVKNQIQTLKSVRETEEKSVRDSVAKQLESRIPRVTSPAGAGASAQKVNPKKFKSKEEFNAWKQEALASVRK